jgi:hypothetical protein
MGAADGAVMNRMTYRIKIKKKSKNPPLKNKTGVQSKIYYSAFPMRLAVFLSPVYPSTIQSPQDEYLVAERIEYYEAHDRLLLFGSHETSPII